jgi:predicted GNAT family acetyltransferase
LFRNGNASKSFGRNQAFHTGGELNDIQDQAGASRFERLEAGHKVFARYRRAGDQLIIDHVEAEPALWGVGAGGRLMEEIVALARDKSLRVVATCRWAARWLQRRSFTDDRGWSSGRQPTLGTDPGGFRGFSRG